ncbi:unnamed protein product [Prunus armeniaca]|uniref:Uncharacterized protein n=1 Tax=Prunus armeniaca TaxID=36596 RepID=A0A6J5WE87_PRUAR|nr:unnamed protein product [Prunus armeniaca]
MESREVNLAIYEQEVRWRGDMTKFKLSMELCLHHPYHQDGQSKCPHLNTSHAVGLKLIQHDILPWLAFGHARD